MTFLSVLRQSVLQFCKIKVVVQAQRMKLHVMLRWLEAELQVALEVQAKIRVMMYICCFSHESQTVCRKLHCAEKLFCILLKMCHRASFGRILSSYRCSFVDHVLEEFPAPPGSAYPGAGGRPGQPGSEQDQRPGGTRLYGPGQGTDQRQGLLSLLCDSSSWKICIFSRCHTCCSKNFLFFDSSKLPHVYILVFQCPF